MQCLEAVVEAVVPILAGGTGGGFRGFFFRLSFSVFAWPLSTSHCPFSRLLEAVEAEEAIKLFSICCEEWPPPRPLQTPFSSSSLT